MRVISFAQALCEATAQEMRADPGVFVMGIGVDDFKGTFGSTLHLVDEFGPQRVFDTPIAEAAMTGFAIGAALQGMRPIHVHIRMDFLYLAMDQIFNMAAKWRYMFGGAMNVPLVIRAVIGRSWGQGSQHSQSLQAIFAHVPGIKVVMPTTAHDAKGLLISAIRDPNPVISIEHRLLFDLVDEVSEQPYVVEFGQAAKRREGKDVTVVATSFMVIEALRAAAFLEKQGVSLEVIDLRTLVPLDRQTIVDSVRKTGRLIAADTGWITCGITAEICAVAAENCHASLKAAPCRLGMAQVPGPTSKPLERLFYPGVKTIVNTVYDMLEVPAADRHQPSPQEEQILAKEFKGPF